VRRHFQSAIPEGLIERMARDWAGLDTPCSQEQACLIVGADLDRDRSLEYCLVHY
jgi:hypothetical protein